MNSAATRGKASITRRLITGSAWATGGKLLAAVSGLLLNALLARLLSPDELGAYFLIFSIILFGMLLAGLGIPQSIVRMIAGNLDGEGRSSVRRRYGWLSCGRLRDWRRRCVYAVVGAQWAGRLFHSAALPATSLLVALLITARTLQTLLSQMYRGFHDIRAAVLLEGIVSNLLVILGTCCHLATGGRPTWHGVAYFHPCRGRGGGCRRVLLGRLDPCTAGGCRPGCRQCAACKSAAAGDGLALFSVNEAHIWIWVPSVRRTRSPCSAQHRVLRSSLRFPC